MRQLGCYDCAQLTGGDCGKHGPMVYPLTTGSTGYSLVPACVHCGSTQLGHVPTEEDCLRLVRLKAINL